MLLYYLQAWLGVCQVILVNYLMTRLLLMLVWRLRWLYLRLLNALSLIVLIIYWLGVGAKNIAVKVVSLQTSAVINYWILLLLVVYCIVSPAHFCEAPYFLSLQIHLIARNCRHIQIDWWVWRRWLLTWNLVEGYTWLLSVESRTLGRKVRKCSSSRGWLLWKVKARWEECILLLLHLLISIIIHLILILL